MTINTTNTPFKWLPDDTGEFGRARFVLLEYVAVFKSYIVKFSDAPTEKVIIPAAVFEKAATFICRQKPLFTVGELVSCNNRDYVKIIHLSSDNCKATVVSCPDGPSIVVDTSFLRSL